MRKLFIKIGVITTSLIFIIAFTLFLSFKWITIVSNGDAIPHYNNPQTAMLVIDVQRNLTANNGTWILNLEQTDKMIDKINRIINESTKKNIIVIYISNEFGKHSIINLMTDRAMEEHTDGAKIDERIIIVNNNHFIKNRMDSFTNDDFETFIEKHYVNHLIITGIDAEDCVDKTIKGAFNRNYQITVISDAIATKSDEKRDKKIVDFRKMGAKILTTKEFLNHSSE